MQVKYVRIMLVRFVWCLFTGRRPPSPPPPGLGALVPPEAVPRHLHSCLRARFLEDREAGAVCPGPPADSSAERVGSSVSGDPRFDAPEVGVFHGRLAPSFAPCIANTSLTPSESNPAFQSTHGASEGLRSYCLSMLGSTFPSIAHPGASPRTKALASLMHSSIDQCFFADVTVFGRQVRQDDLGTFTFIYLFIYPPLFTRFISRCPCSPPP